MIIRKTFKAEVAHRVARAYTTRCRGLHGHSYVFEIFLEGEELDKAGMVMDFKLVKETFNDFLDSFDHSLLVDSSDTFLKNVAPELNDRYILVDYNPTAENMALHIFLHAYLMGLPIVKARVHETVTGYAEFGIDRGIIVYPAPWTEENAEQMVKNVVFSDQIKSEWKKESGGFTIC